VSVAAAAEPRPALGWQRQLGSATLPLCNAGDPCAAKPLGPADGEEKKPLLSPQAIFSPGWKIKSEYELESLPRSASNRVCCSLRSSLALKTTPGALERKKKKNRWDFAPRLLWFKARAL